MRFGIVGFPGSTDRDISYVLEDVLGSQVDQIWYLEKPVGQLDCLLLPGGFSFGDYLRPGALAQSSPILKWVRDFANAGGLVLGIGNGFQILTEAGLLPGALMINKHLKFICQQVSLKLENNETAFTNAFQKGQLLEMPIAHGYGCYTCDDETFHELETNGQIILRYKKINPNGSRDNIAGIVNKEGNICGLMPHPERCAEEILGNDEGKNIFCSIIKSCQGGNSFGK